MRPEFFSGGGGSGSSGTGNGGAQYLLS